MKSFQPYHTIYLLVIILFLLGCKKGKLTDTSSQSNSLYPNLSFTSYQVYLKRTNNYPVGSKILVEGISYTKYNTTNASYVVLDRTLPFNDTTISMIELTEVTLYLKWKILATNSDSLSGGVTTKLTLGNGVNRFDITY